MHKRALVTGGGTGIGRGIALALARRGCAVALAGRRAQVLGATAAEIIANGGQAAALPVDLAQPPACLALIEQAHLALGGPLDALVNNAGVMLPGSFEQTSPARLQQGLHINLTAPMLLTHAALPDLKAGRGSLVLIASQAAWLPLPFAAFYSASKAGLQAFGAALRYELEEHAVHLLMVYPPATATAMTRPLVHPRLPRLKPAKNWPVWFRGADPLIIGEQIVMALERRQAERHWLDVQAPLIFMNRLWPGLVHRLLSSQLPKLKELMAADASDGEIT